MTFIKTSLSLFTVVLLHLFYEERSWLSRFNTFNNKTGRKYYGFTYNPLEEGQRLERGASFMDGENKLCVVETVGNRIILASCMDLK